MTKPKPSVAMDVAISTRDRPEALRHCLESIGAGNAVPAQIIVADQSEDEATRSIVEEAGRAGLPVHYLRARPGGLGVAQNDAVRATCSPVVAVIDDDCIADADWLARIASAFQTDPAPALLGGRVLPLEPSHSGVNGGRTYPISSRTQTEARDFSGKALPWYVGSGNNFAFRREWFDRIGGCNEQLGPGAPLKGGLDMDLFYRVLRAGGRARYSPTVLVRHERTTREGRLSRRTAYGFGMAAAITFWLREGDRYAWRVLGAWILMRIALLGKALLRGRWLAVYEEALVLRGTMQGLVRGLTMTRRPPEKT